MLDTAEDKIHKLEYAPEGYSWNVEGKDQQMKHTEEKLKDL